MKFILLTIFTFLSFLNAEENNGFLMNQKYVCFSVGALKDDKIFPIMSKEDVLKYPIRFYVDDKRILHTDGKVRNLYIYDEKNKLYFEENSLLKLSVEQDERYMMIVPTNGELKGTALIYNCYETDSWTLN